MQRHHRSAASRVGLGTLIAGIALSLVAFGMSPAQASAASAKVPAAASKHTAPTARPCGSGVDVRSPRAASSTDHNGSPKVAVAFCSAACT